jgi:hypothetical protein
MELGNRDGRALVDNASEGIWCKNREAKIMANESRKPVNSAVAMRAKQRNIGRYRARVSGTSTRREEKAGSVRFDFLGNLFSSNRGRDPALLKRKWRRMAQNRFHFFRGSAATFYDIWTTRHPRTTAPNAWVCGDAHWENVGSYRAKNRVTYFDLTDFDQACLAPVDRELGRALSAYHVARIAHLAAPFLSSYRQTLMIGKPQHIEAEVSKGAVARLLASVRMRRRKKFIGSWTEKGRIAIRAGVTYRLRRAERADAARIFNAWGHQRKRAEFFKVLDLCGSLAGVGTLGLRRYLVLVKGGRLPHLIDMKQAAPSVLAEHHRLLQPAWQCDAERVATIQKYTQYVPIAHLGWTQFRGSSFVLSDFQPAEDRIDSLSLSKHEHEDFSRKWGRLLAWSHLRTASWKNSASIDRLIEYGKSLTLPHRRRLLRDAAAMGRILARAYDAFVPLVLGGEK